MVSWLHQIPETFGASQQKMMSSGATFYGGSSLTNCGATRGRHLQGAGPGVRGCDVELELKWTVEAAFFRKAQVDHLCRVYIVSTLRH